MGIHVAEKKYNTFKVDKINNLTDWIKLRKIDKKEKY